MRRTLVTERQEPFLLEGIHVHPRERRKDGVVEPRAPPPSEVSEVESLLPLTQPPPQEEAGPLSVPVEAPTKSGNEVKWFDTVD
jgi:hypothetical protein